MSKAAFDKLPPELMSCILQNIPWGHRNATLFSLATVSRSIHCAAITALYETVILQTFRSVKCFALVVAETSTPGILDRVRNLAVCNDNVADSCTRDYTESIVRGCRGVVNILATSSALLRCWNDDRAAPTYDSLVVLLTPGAQLPTFRNTVRLYIDNLQSAVSRRAQDPHAGAIFRLLTGGSLPQLQCFGSTWFPHIMSIQDHRDLQDIAISVLAIPTVSRFLVRHTGVDADFRALQGLKDVRVVAFSIRTRPATVQILHSWAQSALDVSDMWTGHPLWQYSDAGRERRPSGGHGGDCSSAKTCAPRDARFYRT